MSANLLIPYLSSANTGWCCTMWVDWLTVQLKGLAFVSSPAQYALQQTLKHSTFCFRAEECMALQLQSFPTAIHVQCHKTLSQRSAPIFLGPSSDVFFPPSNPKWISSSPNQKCTTSSSCSLNTFPLYLPIM